MPHTNVEGRIALRFHGLNDAGAVARQISEVLHTEFGAGLDVVAVDLTQVIVPEEQKVAASDPFWSGNEPPF